MKERRAKIIAITLIVFALILLISIISYPVIYYKYIYEPRITIAGEYTEPVTTEFNLTYTMEEWSAIGFLNATNCEEQLENIDVDLPKEPIHKACNMDYVGGNVEEIFIHCECFFTFN